MFVRVLRENNYIFALKCFLNYLFSNKIYYIYVYMCVYIYIISTNQLNNTTLCYAQVT